MTKASTTATRSTTSGARKKPDAPDPSATPIPDQDLLETLNNAENQADFNKLTGDPTVMLKLLRLILYKQESSYQNYEKVKQSISDLEDENRQLKESHARLEESHAKLEQYSRKGVMIMTGVKMEENETPEELERIVIGNLHTILNRNSVLNRSDFVAIHRNGSKYKDNRPPSITIKFIRYGQKDLFFCKEARINRKNTIPEINYFHNLSPYYINIQNDIKGDKMTKWIRYDGDRRGFTVCLDNGKILNYIHSLASFHEKKLSLGLEDSADY